MNPLHQLITRRLGGIVAGALGRRRRRRRREERGDVPGWVLVTVMTAGLCALLYGVADDQLTAMLTDALNKVK